jgi:pyruvate dehydrogenase E2 component (dihydrolipoamide acetyltransferase)
MSTIEVKVPDIGDFTDVPVIEIFVKPGDTVKAEDSLVTLESDKATMDIPAPAAGTVKELKVKLGDKIAEGVTILTLETADAGEARTTAASPAPATSAAGKGGSGETAAKPGADAGAPTPKSSPTQPGAERRPRPNPRRHKPFPAPRLTPAVPTSNAK